MKNKNLIQGYFLLDKVEITQFYDEQLEILKKNYLIEWQLIKEINNRELYYGVLRDETKLEDKQTEEGLVDFGLMTVMSDRNPEILGIWKIDGTPLGQTKIITPAEYSEEMELIKEEIITFEGVSMYPFNKSLYMPYMNDLNTYDETGNIIKSVRPIEPKPILLFSGFKSPKMED